MMRRAGIGLFFMLFAGLVAACEDGAQAGVDGKTSWFGACRMDTECSLGLACKCGVCTRSCSRERDCTSLSSAATCAEPSVLAVECADLPPPARICVATCDTGQACRAGYSCKAGLCVREAKPDGGANKNDSVHDGGVGTPDAAPVRGRPEAGAGGRPDVGAGGSPSDAGRGGSPSDASAGGSSSDAGTGGSPSGTDGADASDAGTGHEPPCPIGPSFPLGTYQLKAIVSSLGAALGGDTSTVTTCSLEEASPTMKIVPSSVFSGAYDVELDGFDWPFLATSDVVHVSETTTTLHLHVDCDPAGIDQCPDRELLDLDLDKRNGIVASLTAGLFHHGPIPSRTEFSTRASGWPICTASTASPPGWVPKPTTPTPALGDCPSTLGCNIREVSFDTGPVPTCPDNDPCSCTNSPDGYSETCCTP